ncbi:site-specific DNA-methyltransferase [Pseudarthrobacter sp. L19]|uniref:site-specific DNA-methyltransferase n=1 Tax=Pseudarthrobacter sp. L19 TaxID=3423951 RepID=UPI003D795D91
MATPVSPRLKRQSKIAGAGFTIDYAGKTPRGQILNSEAGEYEVISPFVKGQNHLIYGDNLRALAHLVRDPSVRGNVKLVYIDPPFATDAGFESRSQNHAYDDTLTGPAFIEHLRQRLVFIHELMASDGTIYLHLDGRMIFQAKMVMDEIFGEKNFQNLITRKKCNPKNYTRKSYGNVSDYILFYSKTSTFTWNRPFDAWDDERSLKEYPYIDEQGRRYKKVPVHAPGVRNGETGGLWKGKKPPPGKHWQYTPAKLDALDEAGDIYWSPTGNPRRKIYLEKSLGIPVQDIWLNMRDAHNQNIRVTGYPTEKNVDMLRQIVGASSNEGDMVLDCYAGSGTTLAAASEMGRRWIGVDQSGEAIETILKRFKHGTEIMGDFVSVKPAALAADHDEIDDFVFLKDVAMTISTQEELFKIG